MIFINNKISDSEFIQSAKEKNITIKNLNESKPQYTLSKDISYLLIDKRYLDDLYTFVGFDNKEDIYFSFIQNIKEVNPYVFLIHIKKVTEGWLDLLIKDFLKSIRICFTKYYTTIIREDKENIIVIGIKKISIMDIK